MNSLKLILLSLFLYCLMVSATGQDVTQPLSPQLDNVTVDPYTGYATIRWLPSISGDVSSYIVYTYSNGIADAVDTIRSPFITEYMHTLSAARYMSITYVVAAMDSSLNISPLSNPLSTIYLEVKNDSCKQRIELRWTPYINQAHPADRYELWLSAGGAPAVLYETVAITDTSYLFDDYLPATRYCFYITASGNAGGLSSSNMQCMTSGKETAPSWVRTDAIIVEDGTLQVTGSYDQATDMMGFITERYKPESQGWIMAGTAAGLNGDGNHHCYRRRHQQNKPVSHFSTEQLRKRGCFITSGKKYCPYFINNRHPY